MGTRSALFKAIITFVGLFEASISTDRFVIKYVAMKMNNLNGKVIPVVPDHSSHGAHSRTRNDWITEVKVASSLAFTPVTPHIFTFIRIWSLRH